MAAKRRTPRVIPVIVDLEWTPLGPKAWLALLLCVPLLGAAWAFASTIDFRPSADPVHTLYAGNFDLPAQLALRSESKEVAETDLVMVGTSREVAGLWQEPRLEAAVGEVLGRPVSLTMLNGYRMRPMDVLYLTGQMRKPRRVLIAINPLSFAWPEELSEHLSEVNFVRSPLEFIDQYHERFGGLSEYTSGWPRLELSMRAHRRLLRRLTHYRLKTWAAVNIYGQPAEVPDPIGRDVPGDRERQAEHRADWIPRSMKRFDENHRYNRRLLGAAIEGLQAQGAEVKLLRSATMDEDPVQTYGPWWDAYHAQTHELAEKYGVEILDFNDAVVLGPDDYVDATHPGQPGRDKISPVFVQSVAGWIEGRGAAATTTTATTSGAEAAP